jgi:phage terminase large subunit
MIEAPPLSVALPRKSRFLLDPPLGSVRYRVQYGGRGSGKSWSFARALLALGYQQPLRIGCFREYQASIRDSVHQLLADQAAMIGLDGFYQIQQTIIRGLNGTEFLFQGIKRDPHKLKSLERINVAWVEEAEAVSDESWSVLIPTIRAEDSEIWVSFNPALSTDPTWRRFIDFPPARSIVQKIGYRDNPWLPDVLREEAAELRKRDPEAYAYIWGGEPWSRSEAEVLGGKWRVEEFEPADHWNGPYYGADWGFANDPTVLVRLWVADSRLWVEYDERGVGWDMDTIARRFSRVPGAEDHVIRSDSARPETINELNRRGFRCVGAKKGKGSVEDGVEHLRGYEEIVIHPRCKDFIREARLWRYKTDTRTGDVLPKLADGHDHGPDAARYALEPLIRQRPAPRVWFPGMDEGEAA